MITPALQATKQALLELDQSIAHAEAHIRVLKAANYPQVIKLESDLMKAKASRKDLLEAIETELNS